MVKILLLFALLLPAQADDQNNGLNLYQQVLLNRHQFTQPEPVAPKAQSQSPSLDDRQIKAVPPYLRLPVKTTAKAGEFIYIKAETNCDEISWLSMDIGLDMVPGEKLVDRSEGIFVAAAKGTYRIAAVGTSGGHLSPFTQAIVVVTDGPEPPPKPDPDPKPKPDPVPPLDPFGQAVKAALVADKGTIGDARSMAQLYRLCAKMAMDKKLVTAKNLFDAHHNARVLLIGDALPQVRTFVGTEENKFGAKIGVLDEMSRQMFEAFYLKVAAAFDTIGRGK